MPLQKPARTYLPAELELRWEAIEPFYTGLLDRKINDVSELQKWLKDRSELEAVLEEEFAWRYIRMTCDTANEKLVNDFEYFATEIEPRLSEYGNKLNEKFLQDPFLGELDQDTYFIYIRSLKKQFELFREENIPLQTELQLEQQKFGAIAGAMSVAIRGQEYTLEQAANFLKEQDRSTRKEAYEKIQERRLQDKQQLDELFNKLIALRHQVALNAGFKNYRDYMFQAMGRFDYTPEDCFAFHDAIEKEIVPILRSSAETRRAKLGYETLQPYDTEVDISGKPPLKPFEGAGDLIDKTISCFSKLHPYMGERLMIMKENNLLDLESRMGKAPGGYNYPLSETGAPFIFMNSADSMRDLTTMVHEGGHAIHTFLSNHLELNDFKRVPSEVAEVASMSMELISMSHWDEFFSNTDDLQRAKEEQLKDVLKTLPWVACIDAFQHWIYTNPTHTVAERDAQWEKLYDRFGAGFVDWSAYPEVKKNLWQKQLHLFEVPFYYIEYGMAQLAAIAIFKNYKHDPERTIEQYFAALKLGYTKTIPAIYKEAGIRFDFSASYIHELAEFIKAELATVQTNN